MNIEQLQKTLHASQYAEQVLSLHQATLEHDYAIDQFQQSLSTAQIQQLVYDHLVNIQDEKAMSDLMDTIDIHFDEDNHVYLDGEDVSKEIRMNNVSMQASKTSQLGIVRKKLVNLQQKVCANKGFIVDGRDICSVVLPDAEVKIFMSASSKARAQRRYDEYISKGIDADYETIYQDIVARDYQDMHREISPLVKTEDAIEIDTSDLTIDEVVSKVLDIVG